ncbi:MAG: DNA mismatch repair protein MutL [Planctomycetaceae bacterium]|nr:DNA mismatch repair protein MutL [Planctomycetaceae bacterium]
MPVIRQLSPLVVNKIAAGEVIERPASVVKELVENSLDAGATRIDVTIEKGGTELIRITDDGCGIEAEQLPLAVASHATSKIADADDLFRVATLGFRGEAVASIASVSRLCIRSRVAEAESAAEIEVVGGRNDGVRPAAGPPGTCIEVRQLFFNTPVRQKFMRTAQTEMSHISEAITRAALAYPRVHFTLSHNGRQLQDLPPSDLPQRIAALFGAELAESLIAVESVEPELHLAGFVANPSQSRPNNRMQYLFLNGRPIRDRSLQHALGEAYRGLLLTGRYPICFLRLDMPPAAIDVNVHPTKLEVRFQDGGRVYSQLLGTLRTKFLSTDLVARGNLAAAASGTPHPGDDSDDNQQMSELVAWAQRQQTFAPGPADEGRTAFADAPPGDAARGPLEMHRVPPLGSPPPGAFASAPPTANGPSAAVAGYEGSRRVAPARAGAPTPMGAASRALQIHDRYLVAETAEGLEVIDQHALHERILYEAIREKVLAGALESQKLLVPEPVDLAASEAAAALEHQDLLGKLGMQIEEFGGETVLISAYPAMLANLAPAEVLRSVVEQLMTEGKKVEVRDLLDELLHMIACKAAVKYGDRLTPEEIDALLAQRHLAADHHHCPHGRPTALVFTREQLDRQFKRI